MPKTDDLQKKIFAENLNRILTNSGVKKSDFAEAMKVSPSAVSHWLDGSTIPRAKVIQNMSVFFGVRMSDLVNPYNPKAEGKTLDMSDLISFINNDANNLVYNGKELTAEQRAAAKSALSLFKQIIDAK